MDQLDILIDKFKQKAQTHPELSKLWIHYLSIKKTHLSSLLSQGEYTLEMLETTDDIPIHSIALLFLMERYSDM
jgi:hypothetical protein